MRQKLAVAISISLLIALVPSISVSNAVTKCTESVTKAVRVKTPITIYSPELNVYINKTYKNKVRGIADTSRKVSGIWWTKGWHECYFTDKNVASGYKGFLPNNSVVGYQTAINLVNETISGGNTILISYYKKNGKWVIAASGSGP